MVHVRWLANLNRVLREIFCLTAPFIERGYEILGRKLTLCLVPHILRERRRIFFVKSRIENGGYMDYRRHVSVLLVTVMISISTVAQTYQGRILGTVTDVNGAAVKGAKVIITNVETGASRTLETNESGDYVAPNLPPGLYRIVAESSGFKKMERTSVRLDVAKDLRIDL